MKEMSFKELKGRQQEKHKFPFIDVCTSHDREITGRGVKIILWVKVWGKAENKLFQDAVILDCHSENRSSEAIQWIQDLNKSFTFGPFQGGILAGSRKIHPSIQKN
jgi:hypothetical protein